MLSLGGVGGVGSESKAGARSWRSAPPPCWISPGLLSISSISIFFKESACSARDLGSIPGWEDPLEKEMATHSSTLA